MVSFLAGLGGGVHCVGMCGGLVTVSCGNARHIFAYQGGRLLGYLSLGIAVGLLGEGLRELFLRLHLSALTAFVLGGLFVYWGLRMFVGKSTEIPTPAFIGLLYRKLWGRFVAQSSTSSGRAFFTGLISILLPCGLLYGMVISASALGSLSEGLLSISFFWLGTLPAMVAAPVLLQKILTPMKKKIPKLYAVGLIALGLFTVFQRGSLTLAPVPAAGASTEVRTCH